VPARPAYDLFSALQSIWLVHLVTSCYAGARDFAFGRMDQYLLPYYEQDLANGSLDRDGAQALLAHFMMKTNEITGTATWNHQPKPTPCQASKQYLMLGGRSAAGESQDNDLTRLILEAAEEAGMPEPVLTVRMDVDSPVDFKRAVAVAATKLGSQIHFFNDGVLTPSLARNGLVADQAHGYAVSGCCRVEMPGQGVWLGDHFLNAPAWLLGVLEGASELASIDDVLEQLGEVAAREVQQVIDRVWQWKQGLDAGSDEMPHFHFESLLIGDCIARGLDCFRGGARHAVLPLYVGGIATVADSLVAIQRLVYDERRFGLEEFVAIVSADFIGHERLREEIVHRLPKFGNDDDEADAMAARAGRVLLDAVQGTRVPGGLRVFGAGFYSLDVHHRWGRELPATPDGRLGGEPVSENQSPVYGADTHGVTALLKSVARLPLDRTVQGGLNVKFAGAIPAQKLGALLDGYFRLGGVHAGFTFVDRSTLLEAQAHPERFRTLCVRLYGFSEYFVALSPEEQIEVIRRTEQT
jgi:trans-4-hydroxy-L-proline dehydratase